ncbi:MAG: TolC family protein [Candidatus Acidiferrales bacterium]
MNRRNLFIFLILLTTTASAATRASAQMHVEAGMLSSQQTSAVTVPENLTLQQAEKIAIQNHPQIQAASYLANAAKAQVTETRSDYYPHVFGSVTGVKAENDSRIGAGALNNSLILSRFAQGVTVQQLVTDFGRTHELVKSSVLHAKAQEENVTTTREDVLLQVDAAYYNVLKAQAVLQVAQETVKDRQLVADQVKEMEKNRLKSGLDVSFANVDLSEAQLLLVQAQNNLQASFADLSAALGLGEPKTFQLTEAPLPPAPPADFNTLMAQAIQNRPELVSRRFDVNAANSYATAERDLWFPTISGVGVAGLTPIAEAGLGPRYAAAGFNVNIPIFNGRQFNALHAEATAQASAQEQYLRDTQNAIVRDVRTAWLNANSGFQRLSITQQLLDAANQALDLAQQRYRLGLSSIIELSQAQLNQTQAAITEASAKYDYAAEISALNYQIGALR